MRDARLWIDHVLSGNLSSVMNADELSRCPKLVRRWARKWDVPELADEIRYEWSTRLRRSLGRAYPERNLIRLSSLLKDAKYAPLFDEVLCHEAAHVAVFHTFGNQAASHGPEWEHLVRIAGYEARSSHKTDSLTELQNADCIRYDHLCPICQATRTAKCPQTKWRCVACQNAGLEGALIIQSRPDPTEVLDV